MTKKFKCSGCGAPCILIVEDFSDDMELSYGCNFDMVGVGDWEVVEDDDGDTEETLEDILIYVNSEKAGRILIEKIKAGEIRNLT